MNIPAFLIFSVLASVSLFACGADSPATATDAGVADTSVVSQVASSDSSVPKMDAGVAKDASQPVDAADASDAGIAVFSLTKGSEPTMIVAGPDGNMWISQFVSKQIAKVTMNFVVTEYSVSGNPYGIAVGSDMNIWFTDGTLGSADAKIGRITTDGTVSEFSLTASSIPIGICAGPDGALWFTEYGTGKIGRITTSGVITEFALPTASSGPNMITTGPDGNLWFTERFSNSIGRMTTTGTETEFPLPNSAAHPEGIVSGPDGNLWFTEEGSATVGRMTPTGTLTEFPVPASFGSDADLQDAIAVGPDGNLWFGNSGATKPSVAHVTPTGTFYSLDVRPNGPRPWGVAAGPDGNMWFTAVDLSQTIDDFVGYIVP